MTAPAIHISDASLTYDQKLLFQQLNITLTGAACTAILGPSGVGKTSLLRLIAGLTFAAKSASPVTASDNLPLAGRIAYMAQQDCLLPWSSVLDNVLISSRLRGEKIDAIARERAMQLLIHVGLADVADSKPEKLSGGMRQRVSLARTLFENKPIVLMDEPFASLDIITRLQLQNLTAELLVDRTVLLVTHDPLEALRLADEIYVMAGEPASLGTPLKPAGKAPRDAADPGLLKLQAQLIGRLERLFI